MNKSNNSKQILNVEDFITELSNLRSVIPDVSDNTANFIRYMVNEGFSPAINPITYIVELKLELEKMIKSEEVRYSIEKDLVRVAEAVFPKEFSRNVNKCYDLCSKQSADFAGHGAYLLEKIAEDQSS